MNNYCGRNRWLVWLACAWLLVAANGCALIPSIQRKFIRKPKSRPPPPVSITVKNYEANMSPEERYRRHFMMWEFWHSELQEGLGDSRKKAVRATEESILELKILHELLWTEKSRALAVHIAELERLRSDLVKGLLTNIALNRWRGVLERQGREIHREFAWKQVEDYVMPADASPPPPLPDVPPPIATQEP